MTATRTIRKLLRLSMLAMLILACQSACSQQPIVLKGVVVDSLEGLPLDSCHITLKKGRTDLHTYTDAKGAFSFRIDAGNDTLFLTISRKDFQSLSRAFVPKTPLTDAGIMMLPPVSKLMEDVVIKARTPAIAVRNDTTEYAIDSFHRKRGAVIGDMLKDLPGFEVDEEGNITHNGKRVSRVLVNGEEFFGGDNGIALGQLPAELVAKLQVMDTKTKEQVFNELESDGEDKTINLKLKTGLQAFGNTQAEGGTGRQYKGNLMANLMEDKRQVGIMGGASNAYKRSITPKAPALASIAYNSGLHYNDKLSPSLKINSGFTGNSNRSEGESRRKLQQFFTADSAFTTDSYSRSAFNNNNYQGSLNLDFEKKTFMGNFSLAYSGSEMNSSSLFSSAITEKEKLRNESERNNRMKSANRNFSTAISISQRFKKKGRNLTLNMRVGNWSGTNNNLNNADNRFYEDGLFLKEEVLRQHILSNNQNRNTSIGLNYLEPITKQLRLQLNQNLELINSETIRRTYNIDPGTGKDIYDTAYSDRWSSTGSRFNTSASLIYDRNKLGLTAGVVLYRYYEARTTESHDIIRQRQNSYSPGLTLNYKISKTRSLRFNFSSSVQNPSIEQLQPVPDNSNPMFIRLGNPALRSALQQTYGISYSASYETGRIMGFSLAYAPVSNSIVNSSWYDADRRRISRFINVSGVYNLRGNWNFSKFVSMSREGKGWNVTGNANFGRSVFFSTSSMLYTRTYALRQSIGYTNALYRGTEKHKLNATLTAGYNRSFSPADPSGINSRSFSIGPRLEWTWMISEKGDISASYQASYNKLSYGPASQRDLEYTDHTVNTALDLSLSERLFIENNFGYRYNGRVPQGFASRQQWLWTAALSLYVFGNNQGKLSLSAVDILNSNSDISRTIGESYIEDAQMPRQRGYYVLSFQYSWVRKSKKM